MSPTLCARFSSGIIEVFCHMLTFSIAIVGISAIRIRLSAFARGGSAPTRSNTISSSSSFKTSISHDFMKSLSEALSAWPVVAWKLAGCSKVEA